jgi:transcriptional regulator with XRE-family HTH domain
LDQDELAARLTRLGWNCSENTVSKIEAGYRRVIDEEVALIARALGVQPGDLFPSGA